jgi:hypothetical protein
VAVKSLVISSRFDVVVNAHNCQASASHRLQRGHKRLKVKNGRSWDHYCKNCALVIIERDIQKLTALKLQFE